MPSSVSRRFWNIVADRIECDPGALVRGRAQLVYWRTLRGATASERYWRSWDALIDAGVLAVTAKLRERTEDGDTMRSCAPFMDVVGHRERWALYRHGVSRPVDSPRMEGRHAAP
ncbi:MAG: hypothetical protein ACYC42_05900 [Lysobacter sp.]